MFLCISYDPIVRLSLERADAEHVRATVPSSRDSYLDAKGTMALVKSVDKGSVGGFVGIMGSGQILHAKKGQWALQKICPPRPDRRRFLTSHATALRKPAKIRRTSPPRLLFNRAIAATICPRKLLIARTRRTFLAAPLVSMAFFCAL